VWRAYVDESQSNQRLDPHTYLLAAALIEDEHAAEARAEIRGLLRPGQRKLHWRDESTGFRTWITKTVAALPALHVVVVRRGHAGEPVERRRRKCVERLAYELTIRNVLHITAEARDPRSNVREVRYFDHLRKGRIIDTGMQLDHVPGPREPLLWIPDAVAGALTAARIGMSEYLDQLDGLVDVVSLDADS
jgi:hypothetical protein